MVWISLCKVNDVDTTCGWDRLRVGESPASWSMCFLALENVVFVTSLRDLNGTIGPSRCTRESVCINAFSQNACLQVVL